MQVVTDTTIGVDEALEKLNGSPHAVKLRTDDNEPVFIRAEPDANISGEYLVNTHISVLDERRTVTVTDEQQVRDAITSAETAEIVRVNQSPWSGNYRREE